MNLGVGDNGVRILKEETVKSILAVSTRPTRMGGYSLGLTAPVTDSDTAWFGHGGAWGTTCSVNWHKKQLKLWVVQLRGGPRPWDRLRNAAADKFFATKIDNSSADAYTGRLK
jgi:CubicO group peptidase (beta-lactamase class C family)